MYDQSEKLISDVFSPKINTVGEALVKEVHVSVVGSEVLGELVDLLYDQMEGCYHKDMPFTREEFHEVAHFYIAARCAYVFGIRGELHPRDVVVPSMFGPVLAAIGRYRDDTANVVLVPAPAEYVEVDPEDNEKLVGKSKARVKCPDCYARVVGAFPVLGLPSSYGLPMDKEVQSDDFFRVEVAADVLRGTSNSAPSPVALFSRLMVEMMYLDNIFGSARVTYSTVGAMRMGLREIVARNVDGMRGR